MNEFERMLDLDPHDWETRRLYADWLDERGEEMRANGQRWQAVNKKAPTPPEMFEEFSTWNWWEDNEEFYVRDGGIPQHSVLEIDLLFVDKRYQSEVYSVHVTRQDAEFALAKRLYELGMEAVPCDA